MPDQTQQTTAATTNAEGQGETPKPLTADMVDAIFEAKLSSYTSKVNKEVESLRKLVKGEKTATVETPAPKSVTHEDLTAIRELGRLEAKIGDETIKALGEDYAALSPQEQARTLRMIANLPKPKTETVEAEGNVRGVTPPSNNPKNPRGEAPRPRDGVPRPKTRLEYERMAKKDRDLLKQDLTFDPTQLPFA